MFLILAGEQSYFNYTPTYAADDTDSWRRWYPEYDKPLGPPLGPAVKTAPYRYQRNFKHASVEIDVAARTSRIEWELRIEDCPREGPEGRTTYSLKTTPIS